MEFQVKVRLTNRQATTLCKNSIERVINMAIEIAYDSSHENAVVSYEDLVELQPIIVELWRASKEAIFIESNK